LEVTVIEGLRTLKLDLVLTLALAAAFLFAGAWLQTRVAPLRTASIPAAAVGGLLFALLVWVLRSSGGPGVALDTSLRAPLQIAFFTTIGFGATLSLLRAGGARMILFFVLASLTAVAQNVAGLGVARLMNAPPALGIICGSLTLTGGPATGLAFTSLFEQKGVAGAGALIIASATFGIFVASLVGNPVATALVRRFRLAPQQDGGRAETKRDEARAADEQFWAIGSMSLPEDTDAETADRSKATTRRGHETDDESGDALAAGELLRSLLVMLAVMGAGALLGAGLARLRVTLPAYVGAMIFAAVVRNLDERFGWFGLNMKAMEALGVVALALFLVIALMDLKLWQLAGLAVPMLVILAAQVVLTVLYAVLVVFTLMGRDYEAAVTASGHIGFGLGVTPNAVANMEALVARFGPAPRSFLYVPVVGAFFIDFSNALVITLFANLIG
jgi:ESS family glutamate:Na+ symporter